MICPVCFKELVGPDEMCDCGRLCCNHIGNELKWSFYFRGIEDADSPCISVHSGSDLMEYWINPNELGFVQHREEFVEQFIQSAIVNSVMED